MNDKELGIIEPLLVEKFYKEQRAIFVHDLEKPDSKGLILDLDALPTKPAGLKEAVIRWLISVNLTRLRNDEEPLVTLSLVLKCPVWKIVNPPLKRITLTKEKMFNKPKVKTLGQKASVGSINKKQKR